MDAEHDHAFLAIPGKYEQFVEIPKTGPKLAVRDTVFVVGYPLDARRDRPQSQQGIAQGIGIAVPIEQILPAHKRALGSTELKNARKLETRGA